MGRQPGDLRGSCDGNFSALQGSDKQRNSEPSHPHRMGNCCLQHVHDAGGGFESRAAVYGWSETSMVAAGKAVAFTRVGILPLCGLRWRSPFISSNCDPILEGRYRTSFLPLPVSPQEP